MSSLEIGLCVGALGHTFAEATQPGMLLAFYGRWLGRLLDHPCPSVRFVAKPLGACAFCHTAWLAVFASAGAGLSVWETLGTVGVACATVQVLQHYISN